MTPRYLRLSEKCFLTDPTFIESIDRIRLREKFIASVFFTLNVRPFSFHHSNISATASSISLLRGCSVFALTRRKISSAYACKDMLDGVCFKRRDSATIFHIVGPITEPCEHPFWMYRVSFAPFSKVMLLPCNEFRTQVVYTSGIPRVVIPSRTVSHPILSNAPVMSKDTPTTNCFLFACFLILPTSSLIAVIVDLLFVKPCFYR